MANDTKLAHEELRGRYLNLVADFLKGKGEDVLRTASNEIAIPCLDENGDDEYIVLTFKVPTGSRDGEAYDGYAIAEDYTRKLAEKAEKAKAAAEAKARKIERSKKLREAKAKAKAEHAAKVEGK